MIKFLAKCGYRQLRRDILFFGARASNIKGNRLISVVVLDIDVVHRNVAIVVIAVVESACD